MVIANILTFHLDLWLCTHVTQHCSGSDISTLSPALTMVSDEQLTKFLMWDIMTWIASIIYLSTHKKLYYLAWLVECPVSSLLYFGLAISILSFILLSLSVFVLRRATYFCNNILQRDQMAGYSCSTTRQHQRLHKPKHFDKPFPKIH